MGSMPRATAVTPIALALVAALLAAGCGAASLSDRETATEAQAAVADAEPTTTADEAIAAETAEATTAVEAEPATVAPAADDAGAWSAVDAGAQAFAAQLDHAGQSIASCETDAAAGDDFNACAGRAYQAMADSATTLVGVIDAAAAAAGGECGTALSAMREATRTLVDDYSSAISTTDWTSADTLRDRIAGDTQAYADTALAAASTCMT